MIACLDANVLYPTVLRALLIGLAKRGAFTPAWSARILGEWRRVAERRGPEDAAIAAAEIARLQIAWPEAAHEGSETPELWLPDPADIHVLATARAASATEIVTFNLRDFPKRELAPFDLRAIHPDAFLLNQWQRDAAQMEAAAEDVLAEARRLSDQSWDMRRLLKKAQLPRLAKALQ